MGKISSERLGNLRELLFGLQKQASVQNDAVCVIVADELGSIYSADTFDSVEALRGAIHDYVQRCVDGELAPEPYPFMLLCGEQSYANLQELGPKVVYDEQPSPDSPKVIFRVNMLGQDNAEFEHEAESDILNDKRGILTPAEMAEGHASETVRETLERRRDERDEEMVRNGVAAEGFYTERIKRVLNEIIPTVPKAVMEELKDEYKAALCCAEYYYKNKM